jgi:hypothetical protein
VSREALTLALADEVAATLAAHHVETAVIGAIAVAIHGFSRATADLDLAAATDLGVLRTAAEELQVRGCTTLLGEPDAEDSLGGVLTVSRDDTDPVQVVNYQNPFRPGSGALAEEAIGTATPGVLGALAVVDLPHLVALKLYAGGAKSKLDVVELLGANPEVDREAIRQICARFGLESEWEEVGRL